MNIFVTGAAGLLGAHVLTYFGWRHQVLGTDRNSWWGDQPAPFIQGELLDRPFLANIFADFSPDVIVHCAGMVDVDGCERNPEKAFQSNVETVRILINTAPRQCLFVYISSDAIFSGPSSFWKETDTPHPPNVYSQSKLEGERVAGQAAEHLIVRTNLYGWSSGRKKTSGEWLYNALHNRDSITLFEDFHFTPIYVTDLARALSDIIDIGHRGVLHVAGRDRVSKHEFGTTMAGLMGVTMENVRRGSVKDAKLTATRSTDLSLSTARARELLGRDMPGYEEGLQKFVSDHGKPLSQRK
jgi:dTDP-4-dehydrorhamnose reductase